MKMKLKIEICTCNKSVKLFIKQKWDKKWIKDYSRIDCQCVIFDTVYTNAEQAGDAMGPDYKSKPHKGGILKTRLSQIASLLKG